MSHKATRRSRVREVCQLRSPRKFGTEAGSSRCVRQPRGLPQAATGRKRAPQRLERVVADRTLDIHDSRLDRFSAALRAFKSLLLNNGNSSLTASAPPLVFPSRPILLACRSTPDSHLPRSRRTRVATRSHHQYGRALTGESPGDVYSLTRCNDVLPSPRASRTSVGGWLNGDEAAWKVAQEREENLLWRSFRAA
jgi:hypothetical protein